GGGAPVYDREYREPAYYQEYKKFNINTIPFPENLKAIADHLISHPNIASKRWVTDQYDSMVGTATMTSNRPSDAAVVAIKGTNKAIALTIDCNSRYVNADPEIGCAIAVAEAARNITCAGGEPVAITNCLNFGNPYVPEVFWQFAGAINGMSAAATKFETPITGGNVSFYNQSSDEGPVFPTPTIGMLGVLDNVETLTTLDFKETGDLIYLIGSSKNDISSSEYLASYLKIQASPAPYFNLEEEYAMHQVIKQLIIQKLVKSVHDVADGGLYINLLESAMVNDLGFDISSDEEIRPDAFLFGEAQGRVVVSLSSDQQEAFVELLAASETEFSLLGTVTDGALLVDGNSFGSVLEAKQVHLNVLHNLLGA
ncbi:MAG: purL, partial [Pedobacter sp.]|nr:purL [Pedobacter sp.]